jgi:hypothetical protein
MDSELITTGVQKFELTYDYYNKIVFQIDFDHSEVKGVIIEMYEYSIGDPDEAESFEEILHDWLQLAGCESYKIFCREQQFNDEYLSNTEGFCRMDGSFGITIDTWDFYSPDPSDFEVYGPYKD